MKRIRLKEIAGIKGQVISILGADKLRDGKGLILSKSVRSEKSRLHGGIFEEKVSKKKYKIKPEKEISFKIFRV